MTGFVLLWLATMASGQTQQVSCAPNVHFSGDVHVNCGYEAEFSGMGPAPYIWEKKVAEHVIEIRTKRIPNGWTRVCWYLTYGDSRPCEEIKTPKYCPEGATCEILQDTHKTLWIDNVKIGTIREVEEK